MNAKLIALASALVATASLASGAEAGGGVRLGFGGPLGTFLATPAHGGGGGSYAKPAKRHAPAQLAARKVEKPARVAKATPARKIVTAKAETNTSDAAKNVTAKADTPAAEAPRLTGSSALIQSSVPVQETDGQTTEAPVSTEPSKNDEKAEAVLPTVTASTETIPDESGHCKKFIPAVGMTVSVGCGE